MKLMQANARVPADGRPVLLKTAARMRADPSFTARLEAFLAREERGQEWSDDLADLRVRIEALEATVNAPGDMVKSHDEANAHPALSSDSSPQPEAQITTAARHCPDTLPMFADGPAMDWQDRAAAITLSTGEGKGRKLTAEGEALFREMAGAGAGAPTIARTLGIASQSVHYRLAKLKEGS